MSAFISTLFILIIITIIAIVVFVINRSGDKQLSEISVCIDEMEKSPSSSNIYDNFLSKWSSFSYLKFYDLCKQGYYDRLIEICKRDPLFLKSWDVLDAVLKKGSRFFFGNTNYARELSTYKLKTVELLAESLSEYSSNQGIVDSLIPLFQYLSPLTPTESSSVLLRLLPMWSINYQRLEARNIISILAMYFGSNELEVIYNTALSHVENNSFDKSLRTFALDMGRLYYSSLRGDKKCTIYDEQAIQNDINVRVG